MPEQKPDVLVVGAAPGSLGEAIARELSDGSGSFGAVHKAGIKTEEYYLDVLVEHSMELVLGDLRPDIVVCTVGINTPCFVSDNRLRPKMHNSFMTNVVGPMDFLRHFTASEVRPGREHNVKKFVAISSNSARIARRNSMAYCASKAALSMALRVAARELAGVHNVAVWGYEPGLLAGTPMTSETMKHFSGDLHRMPGVRKLGLYPSDLAQRIAQDLEGAPYALNGLMIPFDAGEQ